MILETLKWFHRPGEIISIRCKRRDGGASNLTFRRVEDAAARVKLIDDAGNSPAIWHVLNPIKEEYFHGRDTNGWKGVGNGDIKEVRWLPIDVDPVRREAGAEMPATSGELSESRRVCDAVTQFLLNQYERGGDGELGTGAADTAGAIRDWTPTQAPLPLVGFAGNSWHLVYPVEVLPSDTTLIGAVLRGLHKRFSTDGAVVDTRNGNAARVWKLYGTMSRKGAESSGRPWRTSYVESWGNRVPITREKLIQICAALGVGLQAPAAKRHIESVSASTLRAIAYNTEQCLHAIAVNIREREAWTAPDGTPALRWEFKCPFYNDSHGAPGTRSAWCMIFPDGTVSAGCHGNRCADKTWADMLDLLMEQA